jgi:hypothetical protein
MKLRIAQFSSASCYFFPLSPKYFPHHPIFNYPQPTLVLTWETKFQNPSIFEVLGNTSSNEEV